MKINKIKCKKVFNEPPLCVLELIHDAHWSGGICSITKDIKFEQFNVEYNGNFEFIYSGVVNYLKVKYEFLIRSGIEIGDVVECWEKL